MMGSPQPQRSRRTTLIPAHLRRALIGMGLVLMAGMPPAHAQDPATTGTIRGRLVDSETGDPIVQAIVRIRNNNAETQTDQNGGFEFTGLPEGEYDLEMRALGFSERRERVFLRPGQVSQRTYGMDFTGDKLPEIVVSARNEKVASRYTEFHRRLERGLGYYVMWDELKRRGYTSVGESLRGVRGIQVRCGPIDCQIRMSRSRNCDPIYYIDGNQATFFTSSTPVNDIYGMEVYRGASEVPAEFSGPEAGCGVIAIWTKNRPYR